MIYESVICGGAIYLVLLACNIFAEANYQPCTAPIAQDVCIKAISDNYLPCLLKIAEKWFKKDATITYISNNARVKILTKYPYYSVSHEGLYENNLKYNNYVIYCNDSQTIKQTTLMLKQKKVLKSKSKFIFLVNHRYENVKEIFEALWNLDVYNQIIIIVEDSKILYANPYQRDNQCGKVVEYWESIPCKEFQIKNDYDYTKCNLTLEVFTKIYREPFTTEHISSQKAGLFVSILQLIMNKLSINISYSMDPYDEKEIYYINKDSKSSLKIMCGSILNKTADTRTGFIQIISEMYEYFEVTRYLFFSHCLWLVPKPSLLSNIKILSHAFSNHIWMCVIFTFVTLSIVYWTLNKLTITESIFQIYEISMHQITFNARPTHIKIFLLSTTLFCMHLVSFYQARLSSMLTSPGYEAGINSFEELIDSNLSIVMHKLEKLQLVNFTFRGVNLHDRIISQGVGTDYIDKLERMIAHKNFSAKTHELLFKVVPFRDMLKPIGSEGLFPLMPVYLFRRGHPLFQIIDAYMLRVHELGFYNYWVSKFINNTINAEAGLAVKLQFEHVQGAFIILIVGLGVGFCVFVCEIIVFKIMK